jgi:hypothetical protein
MERCSKKKLVLCLALAVIGVFVIALVIKKKRGGPEEIIEAEVQVIET